MKGQEMRSKLKAMGSGFAIAIAMACLIPINAPAANGGHFVFGAPHAQLALTLTQPPHQMYFKTEGSLPTTCTVASHLGTTNQATTTQLDIVQSLEKCYTNSGTPEPPEFKATLNGCVYRFTVAPNTTSESEQTIDFVCPLGSVAEFHDPNCTITMRSQTAVNAATYTTAIEDGRHVLTFDMHAKFETDFHGGLCVFLGTKHVTELQGAATLRATNTAGEVVDVTAT
jgi:hypothetical protein